MKTVNVVKDNFLKTAAEATILTPTISKVSDLHMKMCEMLLIPQ